jgi:TatD DNase family protein
VFRRHLMLSQNLHLPVIIHTRDADEDTEQLLREIPPAGGVIHCFTSGERLADYAIDAGLLISFSGIVTFPKSLALAQIAGRIPLDRLFVETDCPYLAPVPHRGQRNEPLFVADTARFIAGLRKISLEELAKATSANFLGLFAFKSS